MVCTSPVPDGHGPTTRGWRRYHQQWSRTIAAHPVTYQPQVTHTSASETSVRQDLLTRLLDLIDPEQPHHPAALPDTNSARELCFITLLICRGAGGAEGAQDSALFRRAVKRQARLLVGVRLDALPSPPYR
jgi:hypothetical protein